MTPIETTVALPLGGRDCSYAELIQLVRSLGRRNSYDRIRVEVSSTDMGLKLVIKTYTPEIVPDNTIDSTTDDAAETNAPGYEELTIEDFLDRVVTVKISLAYAAQATPVTREEQQAIAVDFGKKLPSLPPRTAQAYAKHYGVTFTDTGFIVIDTPTRLERVNITEIALELTTRFGWFVGGYVNDGTPERLEDEL